MADYLILAQFGETIETLLPIDAMFGCSDDVQASDDYIVNNFQAYRKRYPRAISFKLYESKISA